MTNSYYDDKTQVLTPTGWKYIKELKSGEYIAQVSNNIYEFVPCNVIKKENYNGDMIHFYDFYGKLDILVTPNHNMCFYCNNKLKIYNAEIVKIGAWGKDMLRSVESVNLNTHLTPLERLNIAFQADGSYSAKGDKVIKFNLQKKRKIDRIIDIAKDCGLDYSVYKLHDGRTEVDIKCKHEKVSKNFNWVDISNLSSEWCREFIEELSYWDATRRSDVRFKFDTTNKSVLDVVELICISAGYGCLYHKQEDNRKDIFSDIHTLHIMKNNHIGGQSQYKEVLNYNGDLYCVDVPSGMIIVKRNKSTIISTSGYNTLQRI